MRHSHTPSLSLSLSVSPCCWRCCCGSMEDPRSEYGQLFVEDTELYNRIVLGTFLPQGAWAPLPRFFQTWLRNYIGGVLLYLISGLLWCFYIYYWKRNVYVPKGISFVSSLLINQYTLCTSCVVVMFLFVFARSFWLKMSFLGFDMNWVFLSFQSFLFYFFNFFFGFWFCLLFFSFFLSFFFLFKFMCCHRISLFWIALSAAIYCERWFFPFLWGFLFLVHNLCF